MSLNDDRVAHQSGGWRRLRLIIVTAAAVFAGLAILNALAIGYAVAGFVIVAGAAYLSQYPNVPVTLSRRLSPACLIR
jgi:hypothetical protein